MLNGNKKAFMLSFLSCTIRYWEKKIITRAKSKLFLKLLKSSLLFLLKNMIKM